MLIFCGFVQRTLRSHQSLHFPPPIEDIFSFIKTHMSVLFLVIMLTFFLYTNCSQPKNMWRERLADFMPTSLLALAHETQYLDTKSDFHPKEKTRQMGDWGWDEKCFILMIKKDKERIITMVFLTRLNPTERQAFQCQSK